VPSGFNASIKLAWKIISARHAQKILIVSTFVLESFMTQRGYNAIARFVKFFLLLGISVTTIPNVTAKMWFAIVMEFVKACEKEKNVHQMFHVPLAIIVRTYVRQAKKKENPVMESHAEKALFALDHLANKHVEGISMKLLTTLALWMTNAG